MVDLSFVQEGDVSDGGFEFCASDEIRVMVDLSSVCIM